MPKSEAVIGNPKPMMLKGDKLVPLGEVGEEAHSKFSPSKVSRLLLCPGSHAMSEGMPNPTNAAAERGTQLHAHMERIVRGFPYLVSIEEVDPYISINLDTLKTGGMNAEDRDAIRFSLECLRDIIAKHDLSMLKWNIEERVYLTNYGLDDVNGTPDVRIFNRQTGELEVIDWKFGHTPVAIEDNAQLKTYAVGALADVLEMRMSDNDPAIVHVKGVNTHIVQPALDAFLSATYMAGDLIAWCYGPLSSAIQLAEHPEAYKFCRPSDEACRWCLAKGSCPYRADHISKLASLVFTEFRENLSVEEVQEFLKGKDEIKAYIKDCEAYLKSLLMQGKEVPGTKLIRGSKNRCWINEEKTIEWMVKNTEFDMEEFTTTTCLSPAKLEKLDRSFKKDPEFAKLFHKPEGDLRMAPESHKSPAVTMGAQSAFAEHIEDAGSL